MKKQVVIWIILLFNWACLQGQSNCSNAQAIVPGNQYCGNSGGQPGDFPANGSSPINPCHAGYNEDEAWYSYTAPQNNEVLDISVTGITQPYAGVFVFDACPGGNPNCIARDYNGNTVGNFFFTTPGLVAGQVYYIVIVSDGPPGNTDYCLRVTRHPPTGCNITNVVPGFQSACDITTNLYHQVLEISYINPPNPGQLSVNGQGYTVGTSPQNVTLQQLVANGTLQNVNALISPGGLGGCQAFYPKNFISPADCLAMDDVCNCWDLTSDIGNGPQSFGNFGAAFQLGEPSPPIGLCTEQNGWGVPPLLFRPVWFCFQAPPSGNISIEVVNLSMRLALWEANSCNGILINGQRLFVAANDINGGCNFNPSLTDIRCLIPGKTYFIQVDSDFGDEFLFDITLTDPGNACSPPPGPVACGSSNNCVESTAHGEWLHFTDGSGQATASMNDRGIDLDQVCMELYVHNGAVRQDANGVHYLNRDWTITGAWQPNSNINLRFYLTPVELNDLIAASPLVNNVNDLVLVREPAGVCNSFNPAGGVLHNQVSNAVIDQSGNYMLEFSFNSLVAKYYLRGNAPLPVELLSFRAFPSGNDNLLEWATASEVGMGWHVVERSSGDGFKELGRVAAAGGSGAELDYEFTDPSPLPLAYYRLRMVDLDGSEAFSPVVSVRRESEVASLAVFPVPAAGQVVVKIEWPGHNAPTLTLSDLSGRTLRRFQVSWDSNRLQLALDLATLPGGMYFLTAEGGGKRVVEKVVLK